MPRVCGFRYFKHQIYCSFLWMLEVAGGAGLICWSLFCGCHKWVTLKTIIIPKNPPKCLESKRVRYSQNSDLIIRHTVTWSFHPCHKYQEQLTLIWHLLFQSEQWKPQNNVWNMFKFNNNKDVRTRSITSS